MADTSSPAQTLKECRRERNLRSAEAFLLVAETQASSDCKSPSLKRVREESLQRIRENTEEMRKEHKERESKRPRKNPDPASTTATTTRVPMESTRSPPTLTDLAMAATMEFAVPKRLELRGAFDALSASLAHIHAYRKQGIPKKAWHIWANAMLILDPKNHILHRCVQNHFEMSSASTLLDDLKLWDKNGCNMDLEETKGNYRDFFFVHAHRIGSMAESLVDGPISNEALGLVVQVDSLIDALFPSRTTGLLYRHKEEKDEETRMGEIIDDGIRFWNERFGDFVNNVARDRIPQRLPEFV